MPTISSGMNWNDLSVLLAFVSQPEAESAWNSFSKSTATGEQRRDAISKILDSMPGEDR